MQWWKKLQTGKRYAKTSPAWLIYLYLGKHEFFPAIHCQEKQGSLCLLRGSPAFTFSALLKWIQCVKKAWEKKVFTPKGLLYPGKIKALEISFGLILSEKNWIPHKNDTLAFTKFPTYFQTWSLAHGQSLSILITFGSFELSSFISVPVGRIWFNANYCLVIICKLFTLVCVLHSNTVR